MLAMISIIQPQRLPFRLITMRVNLSHHTYSTCLYAGTLLVSAFLLFLVQPLFARLVLPLLGGSPGVWNTCMVFFQSALLAGYAYAHFVSRRVPLKGQILLQIVLVAIAFALL